MEEAHSVLDVRPCLVPVGRRHWALVSACDYAEMMCSTWSVTGNGHTRYAHRKPWAHGKRQEQMMHRAILLPPAHLVVDHINGNGLDNRRENLRPATHSENGRNQVHRKRV